MMLAQTREGFCCTAQVQLMKSLTLLLCLNFSGLVSVVSRVGTLYLRRRRSAPQNMGLFPVTVYNIPLDGMSKIFRESS